MIRVKDRVLLFNATCIGRRLDGIGTYTLELLKGLARVRQDLPIEVVMNREAAAHVEGLVLPCSMSLRWVTGHLSPNHGLRGHLLRLLYANLASPVWGTRPVFTASPLEAVFFRRRQVITVHDIIPLLFRREHGLQYWYYRHFLGSVIRSAARVIVPSHHTGELVARTYRIREDRLKVIHHGIDHIAGTDDGGSRDKEEMILYVGRLGRTKNTDRVVRAFEAVKDRIGHRLVLVGEGPAGSGDRVRFTGYLPGREVRNLYRRAALFLFPTMYEGFGFPPLEAMAHGCPVVASAAGSIPEICGEAAYYVDPCDTGAIASGIERVLADHELRRTLIARGRERAALFSWERSAREHLRVFEECMDG